MPQTEIELLNDAIAQLKTRQFDLDAWKARTLILVARIFGQSSELARLLRALKYDNSSWNLRDTSGGARVSDPVREKAQEILEAGIRELQYFGSPQSTEDDDKLRSILSNELTGREMQELNQILNQPIAIQKKALQQFFGYKDKEILTNILTQLIINT